MTTPSFQPKTVLAVAAHADDMDWWAGGTIAHWTNTGVTVYLLVLTDGSKGTADHSVQAAELATQRQHEQRRAAQQLGIAEVFFANFEDGQLYDTPETRGAIVRYIRQLKPDTVLSWDPAYRRCQEYGLNHPDHQAAGAATAAAVYPLARDHANYPELGLPTHAVKHVLLINPKVVRQPTPQDNIWTCDISDTFDTKTQAVQAHASQASGLGPLDALRTYDAKTGRHFDMALAEAFLYLHQP